MNKYFGSEDSILEVMKLSLALLAESSDECGDLLSGCGSLSPSYAFRLHGVVHDMPVPMAGLAEALSPPVDSRHNRPSTRLYFSACAGSDGGLGAGKWTFCIE